METRGFLWSVRRVSVRGYGRPARKTKPFRRPLAGGVMMCANDGGVDCDDPVEIAFGIGLTQQSYEDILPGAVGRPLLQTVVGAPSRGSGGFTHSESVRRFNTIVSITCRDPATARPAWPLNRVTAVRSTSTGLQLRHT